MPFRGLTMPAWRLFEYFTHTKQRARRLGEQSWVYMLSRYPQKRGAAFIDANLMSFFGIRGIIYSRIRA